VGDAVFGVRVRGSYLLLLVACTLSIVAALGQGILISTITSSQQAAFQIAVLATMLPSMLLSGFVFPIRNMPEAIQAVTYVLPARYFVEVLRAVMLKGTGLAECWPALACVAAYAVLVTLVATARMSRARLV